jgi:hypothetical protein
LKNSIKQVIESIEALNFNEIELIAFEKYPDTNIDKIYPLLTFYLDDGQMTFDKNVNLFNLRFRLMDVVSNQGDKDLRRKEVISDCFSIASGFVEHLRGADFGVNAVTTATPLNSVLKDGLGGVEFTVTFNISKICLT